MKKVKRSILLAYVVLALGCNPTVNGQVPEEVKRLFRVNILKKMIQIGESIKTEILNHILRLMVGSTGQILRQKANGLKQRIKLRRKNCPNQSKPS